MPSKSPSLPVKLKSTLRELGQQLRNRRKLLGISAGATAEAADISRVTLYRIEKGDESVTMGAYLSVAFALGLGFAVSESGKSAKKQKAQKVPLKIRIADFKQLKKIAWQIKGTKEISPQEALDLYERNWRHVDVNAMDKREHRLVQDLLAAFGRDRLLV